TLQHSDLRIALGLGGGAFGPYTSTPLPFGLVHYGLAVGDLDGDGRPDLLAGLAGSLDQLYWLPGTAQGFGAPALLSAAVQRDERPGLVDIDGDGDLDILSSSPAGGLLLRNHGGGQFVAEAHAFASYRLVRWTFGDVDGNGTLDAIAQQPYLSRGRTSAIVLQDPNGTFAAPLRLAAAIDALHDVDLDGDLDALGAGTVFNRSATGSFGRLRQFGQGTPGHYNVRPRINDLGVTAPGKPMTMRVSGMRGAAAGLWVLGFGDAAKVDDPLPGLTLYVDQIAAVVPFVAGGPPGAPGAGEWVVPWTMIGGLGGVALSSQAFCADAAAPNGWTQTNGKVLVLPN
ncbi:MAG: VCBS repeat-containing protein, partial [Planctomycetes bacterium]|nr:VCBS repeat-containing protein [Planctomycetota bacterium]